MLHVVLISLSVLSAEQDFAPRLKTLAFHLDRLSAITVADPFAAEKSAKLDELQKLLAAGAQNDEQFNALYRAMDGVRTWLWEHAADQPRRPSGGLTDTDVAWVVKTPQLELSIAKADLSMVVTAASQPWRFLPCDDQDVEGSSASFGLQSAKNRTVAPFNTGYSVGLTMALSDFPDAPGLELYLTANLIGREIVFELAAREATPTLAAVNWPKAVELGNAESDVSVIPRMQGMLVPGNWPQAIEARDLCNSRSFYMPWWGQIRDGHGVQVILETSDDAGGTYAHAARRPHAHRAAVVRQPGTTRLFAHGSLHLRRARDVRDDVQAVPRVCPAARDGGDFARETCPLAGACGSHRSAGRASRCLVSFRATGQSVQPAPDRSEPRAADLRSTGRGIAGAQGSWHCGRVCASGWLGLLWLRQRTSRRDAGRAGAGRLGWSAPVCGHLRGGRLLVRRARPVS